MCCERCVLCRYDLLEHQRTGSQGITNFAVATGETTRGAGGAYDFALKFFSSRLGFNRITAMHGDPEAAKCMGLVEKIMGPEEAASMSPIPSGEGMHARASHGKSSMD